MNKIIDRFQENIILSLSNTLNVSNNLAVPRVIKVVITSGIGKIKDDKNKIAYVLNDLTKIIGQKPKYNKSKMAVSAFRLRIGQIVGYTVTLRRRRMYEFLDKLVNISLPRIKDFRGLKESSFDGSGNYSIGILEHTIMPEIKHEEVKFPFGFQINIKTTAKDDQSAKILLEKLGFPFKKE